MSLVCWNCGQGVDEIPLPMSRHATCPACFNELHCCQMCEFFDPQQTMQCFEERAEPPLQKTNANFCEFFKPKANAFNEGQAEASGDAKAQLDALFDAPAEGSTDAESNAPAIQAPEEQSAADLARKKLDDLFN